MREYFTASVRYSPSKPGSRELTCVAVQAMRSAEDIAVKGEVWRNKQIWDLNDDRQVAWQAISNVSKRRSLKV